MTELAPRIFWAIYRSPAGAPAPFYAAKWEALPGGNSMHGWPMYAASEEAAERLVPRDRCEEMPPSTAAAESPDVLSVWRER